MQLAWRFILEKGNNDCNKEKKKWVKINIQNQAVKQVRSFKCLCSLEVGEENARGSRDVYYKKDDEGAMDSEKNK
jgi:hypothetical protein